RRFVRDLAFAFLAASDGLELRDTHPCADGRAHACEVRAPRVRVRREAVLVRTAQAVAPDGIAERPADRPHEVLRTAALRTARHQTGTLDVVFPRDGAVFARLRQRY